MDRFIVNNGEQTDEVDILKTNKNTYIALAKFAQAVLGSDTVLHGFACTENSVPNMNVKIAPGEIYQVAAIDTTAYGDLPVDSRTMLHQGINLDNLPSDTFTFAAPTVVGQSVNYLIECALQTLDTDTENRQFFNAAPQVVPTIRQDKVTFKALAGTPAATGSQVTPTVEPGYVPVYIVTIAYGATTINNSNIVVHPNAPFIPNTLSEALTQAEADLRYGKITTIQSGGYLFAAATGSANTYVADINPAIVGYTTGMLLRVAFSTPNTGASTINFNGFGTKNIKVMGGYDLFANELPAIAELCYDGTNFILLNPARIAIAASAYPSAATSITNNNIPAKVNYDTVLFDSCGLWDATNKCFKFKRIGVWKVNVKVFVVVSPGGDVLSFVRVNGTTYYRLDETSASSDSELIGSILIKATAVTDFVEVFLSNDTTSTLGIGSGVSPLNAFEVEYLGA